MPTYTLTKVAEYPAVGGYPESQIDEAKKKEHYTPTTVGVFTIMQIEAHTSPGRWQFSTVPWGAETKIESKVVSVKRSGKWSKLRSLPKWSRYKTDKEVYDALVVAYNELFDEGAVKSMGDMLGISRRGIIKKMGAGVLAESPSGSEIPDKWLLNDFGHRAIKYYKDNNHDGKFNKGDERMNDFMHSSPNTEAWSAIGSAERTHLKSIGKKNYKEPVDDYDALFDSVLLGFSHGCIHVYPFDIDQMVDKGYLKKGSIVEVHKYDTPPKLSLEVKRRRTLAYEVHFFPKDNKLVAYKTSKAVSSP